MAKVLIHVGTGDARETYEYQHGKLLNVEFGAMERMTGLVGGELEQALNKGGINALTALVWVLRKRQEPMLRFEQVVFNVDEIKIEPVNDDGSPLADDDEDEQEEPGIVVEMGAPKAPAGRAASGGKKKSASR